LISVKAGHSFSIFSWQKR